MSVPTPEFYFAFDGTMAPSIGTMTLRHYNAAGVEQTPAYTTGPFGQAVLCDTAGDYLESDEIAPWDIDTNDFWFELYITVIAATGELQLLSQRMGLIGARPVDSELILSSCLQSSKCGDAISRFLIARLNLRLPLLQ